MEESRKKEILLTSLFQYRESCIDNYRDHRDDIEKLIEYDNMDDEQRVSFREVVEINEVIKEIQNYE